MSELTPQAFLNLCESGESAALEQYHDAIMLLPERQRLKILRRIHDIDSESYNILHPIHLACIQDNLDLLIVLTQVYQFDLFQEQTISINLPKYGYIPKRSSPIHTCIRATAVSCFLYLMEQCAILTAPPGTYPQPSPPTDQAEEAAVQPTLARLLFPRDVHSITPLLLSIIMNAPFFTYHISLFFSTSNSYHDDRRAKHAAGGAHALLHSKNLLDQASIHFATMPKKTIKYNPAKLALVVSLDKLTIPVITRIERPYQPTAVLGTLSQIFQQSLHAMISPALDFDDLRGAVTSASSVWESGGSDQHVVSGGTATSSPLDSAMDYAVASHFPDVNSISDISPPSTKQQRRGKWQGAGGGMFDRRILTEKQLSLASFIYKPTSSLEFTLLLSSSTSNISSLVLSPQSSLYTAASSGALSSNIDPFASELTLYPTSVSFAVPMARFVEELSVTDPTDQQLTDAPDPQVLVDSLALCHVLLRSGQEGGTAVTISHPSSSSHTMSYSLPVAQTTAQSSFIDFMSDKLPPLLQFFQNQSMYSRSLCDATQHHSSLEEAVVRGTPHVNAFLCVMAMVHYARGLTPIMGSLYHDSKLAEETDPLSIAAAYSPQSMMLLLDICLKQSEADITMAITDYLDEQSRSQQALNSPSIDIVSTKHDRLEPSSSLSSMVSPLGAPLAQSSSQLPTTKSFQLTSTTTDFPPLAHLLHLVPEELKNKLQNPWTRLLLKVNSHQWNCLHNAAYVGNTESLFIILQYYRFHYNQAMALYQQYLQFLSQSTDATHPHGGGLHGSPSYQQSGLRRDDLEGQGSSYDDLSGSTPPNTSIGSIGKTAIQYEDITAGFNVHTLFLSAFHTLINQTCNASHVLAGNTSTPLHICCRHTPPYRLYPDVAIADQDTTIPSTLSSTIGDAMAPSGGDLGPWGSSSSSLPLLSNGGDRDGNTPTQQLFALKYQQHPYRDRYIQSFLLLLELGVNVNAQDSRGLTVLHCICIQRDLGLLRLLLDYCLSHSIDLNIQYVSEIMLSVPLTQQVTSPFSPSTGTAQQQTWSNGGTSSAGGASGVGTPRFGDADGPFGPSSHAAGPSTPRANGTLVGSSIGHNPGSLYNNPSSFVGGGSMNPSGIPYNTNSSSTRTAVKVDIPRFTTAYQICRLLNWVEGCELLVKYALLRSLLQLTPSSPPLPSYSAQSNSYQNDASHVHNSFERNLTMLMQSPRLHTAPSERQGQLLRSLSTANASLRSPTSKLVSDQPSSLQRRLTGPPTTRELFYHATSLLVPDPQLHASAFEWYLLQKATQDHQRVSDLMGTQLSQSLGQLQQLHTDEQYDSYTQWIQDSPLLTLYSTYFPFHDGGEQLPQQPPCDSEQQQTDTTSTGELHADMIAKAPHPIDIGDDSDGTTTTTTAITTRPSPNSQHPFVLPERLAATIPLLMHQTLSLSQYAPAATGGRGVETPIGDHLPLLSYTKDFFTMHLHMAHGNALYDPIRMSMADQDCDMHSDSTTASNHAADGVFDMNVTTDHISFAPIENSDDALAIPHAVDAITPYEAFEHVIASLPFLSYINVQYAHPTTIGGGGASNHPKTTNGGASDGIVPSQSKTVHPLMTDVTTFINSPLYSYYTLTALCYSDLLTVEFAPYASEFLFDLCETATALSNLAVQPTGTDINALSSSIPRDHHHLHSSLVQMPRSPATLMISPISNKMPKLCLPSFTTTYPYGSHTTNTMAVQLQALMCSGFISQDRTGAVFFLLNGHSQQQLLHHWLTKLVHIHIMLRRYGKCVDEDGNVESTPSVPQEHQQPEPAVQHWQQTPSTTADKPDVSLSASSSRIPHSSASVPGLTHTNHTDSPPPSGLSVALTKQRPKEPASLASRELSQEQLSRVSTATSNKSEQRQQMEAETELSSPDELVIGSYRQGSGRKQRKKGEGKHSNRRHAHIATNPRSINAEDSDDDGGADAQVSSSLLATSMEDSSLHPLTETMVDNNIEITRLQQEIDELFQTKEDLSERLEAMSSRMKEQGQHYTDIISRQKAQLVALEQSCQKKSSQIEYLQGENARLLEALESQQYSGQPVLLDSGILVHRQVGFNTHGDHDTRSQMSSTSSQLSDTSAVSQPHTPLYSGKQSLNADGSYAHGSYDPMQDDHRVEQNNRELLLKKKVKGKNASDDEEKKSKCCCCCCCCC